MPTSIPNYLDASSQLLYAAAIERGITCETFPETQVIKMSYQGKSWYTAGSRTSFQSAIGQTIADNKALTKVFLKTAQAPTAESVLVTDENQLMELKKLHFPLVMKPQRGAHGVGVIVGLADFAAARTAFLNQTNPVIFEELLQGTEFRIVCINFKFAAAALRQPAQVTGDGQHTIAELIELKNQHPWRAEGHRGKLSLIKIDEILIQNLAQQQLVLTSRPAEKQVVILRQTANLSTGGEAWDLTDQVSPVNQRLFETIAQTCDLNVIGIDVMCQNLTDPIAHQPKAGIIEINKSPGLRMHHFPVQGRTHDLAGQIIDFAIKEAIKL